MEQYSETIIKRRYNAEFYYVGKIPHIYRYWAPVAAARRGFEMVLFTASRENTFVGSTCALPSALLVLDATNQK